jgi:hypothetical protein
MNVAMITLIVQMPMNFFLAYLKKYGNLKI